MGQVLHASYSGYFPSCILPGTPAQPRDYLSLSLVEAISLYWRIKKWEGSCSGSFNSYGVGEIEFTSSNFVEMQPSVALSEEQDLVCKGNENFLFTREVSAKINGSPVESASLNFLYNFSNIQNNGLIYYPIFSMASVNTLSSFTPEYSAKVGIYKISYLDYSITGSIYSLAGSSGSVLFEIKAKEYWPYGGIYDTLTGNRL